MSVAQAQKLLEKIPIKLTASQKSSLLSMAVQGIGQKMAAMRSFDDDMTYIFNPVSQNYILNNARNRESISRQMQGSSI